MVLVQKWPFFQLFLLSNLEKENVFNDSLEGKNAFLGHKKKKFKKSKNSHFSQEVNPWFWSENDHFSNFFFLSNLFQENDFNHMLETKNAFLGYKNKKFKKVEKPTFFPRG